VSKPSLRLYTDRLSPNASFGPLGKLNRAIYICEGKAVVRCAGTAVSLAENSVWQGSADPTITTGSAGARLLRWELSREEPKPPAGADMESELILQAEPHLETGVDYLMRCDRVDFPPSGVAFTHTHKGSGIRCLQSGRIRIETQGHDFWIDPGGAWFETGVDPVFAETRDDGPSHFIRVMILPRSIRGKSSITYVKPEDQDKPKTQKYQVFVDEPIDVNAF
jgi:hypothetical protein